MACVCVDQSSRGSRRSWGPRWSGRPRGGVSTAVISFLSFDSVQAGTSRSAWEPDLSLWTQSTSWAGRSHRSRKACVARFSCQTPQVHWSSIGPQDDAGLSLLPLRGISCRAWVSFVSLFPCWPLESCLPWNTGSSIARQLMDYLSRRSRRARRSRWATFSSW